MNMGYCVSVFTIQNARKWLDIAAQYHAYIANRKKLYIAKSNLNFDNTNGSTQDGLQDSF